MKELLGVRVLSILGFYFAMRFEKIKILTKPHWASVTCASANTIKKGCETHSLLKKYFSEAYSAFTLSILGEVLLLAAVSTQRKSVTLFTKKEIQS